MMKKSYDILFVVFLILKSNNLDIPSCMNFVEDKIINLIKSKSLDTNIKVQLTLVVSVYNDIYKKSNPVKEYQRIKKDNWEGDFIRDEAYFYSITEGIRESTGLNFLV